MEAPRTEQVYSRGENGTGWLTFRQRQIDPALIRARLDHAEQERLRKGHIRAWNHDIGHVNYHPVHRANATHRTPLLGAPS